MAVSALWGLINNYADHIPFFDDWLGRLDSIPILTSDQICHISDSKQFTERATNSYLPARDFRAVPAKYRAGAGVRQGLCVVEPVRALRKRHGNLGGTNSTSATPTMRNPWTALPKNPSYVLASDVALLECFNATASARHRYDLSLFPEPFLGSAAAPVVVLNLNPGWSPDDAAVHADPTFAAMSRRSLEHTLDPYPFLHLQPDSNTPGATWWRQRTRQLALDVGFDQVRKLSAGCPPCIARQLALDVGFDQVARQLACIQFVPYHSSKYAGCPRLPSQEYSFHLVRQAMLREAEIVIMRSVNLWLAAVPELTNYSRVHRGANPRAPFISRGNLKKSYDIVLERMRSAVRNP